MNDAKRLQRMLQLKQRLQLACGSQLVAAQRLLNLTEAALQAVQNQLLGAEAKVRQPQARVADELLLDAEMLQTIRHHHAHLEKERQRQWKLADEARQRLIDAATEARSLEMALDRLRREQNKRTAQREQSEQDEATLMRRQGETL